MGQFKQYVESYHPSLLNRALQVVVPLAFVVKAALSHTLEDILWAASLVVLMLPFGIAPQAYAARMAALDRRPVLSVVFMSLVLAAGLFAMLVEFLGLSRATSVLIAVPVALAASISGLRRRERPRRSA